MHDQVGAYLAVDNLLFDDSLLQKHPLISSTTLNHPPPSRSSRHSSSGSPSPVADDDPFFSTTASMSGSSTSAPSLCDNPDDFNIQQHPSIHYSSAAVFRKPALPPLSILNPGPGPRNASPWSSVDCSSDPSFRRGSLPTLLPDHPLHDSRPFTAPHEHIYSHQSTWPDHDDLSRFAYNAYPSPSDDPPLSALGTFSSAAASPRLLDFPFPSSSFDDEFPRSRPSTRGGEYPAYIPGCQETIHPDATQLLVDPNSMARSVEDSLSCPDIKPVSLQDQLIHPYDTVNQVQVQVQVPTAPSPSTLRKNKERSRASPIIENFKSGVVPPIKRRGKLPKETTELLKRWIYEHAQHPYPTEEEKRRLCSLTGLTFNQVSNWMINARRRILPTRNTVQSVSGSRVSTMSRTSCSGPSSSGSVNEQSYQATDHSIGRHSPRSTWDHHHQPQSLSHTPPPPAFYTQAQQQPYSAPPPPSNDPSIHLVDCVNTSQLHPYGLSAGGNPFNYHGSLDSNILSRTSIDSKQFLDQTYSAFDRTQMQTQTQTQTRMMMKREQVVHTLL